MYSKKHVIFEKRVPIISLTKYIYKTMQICVIYVLDDELKINK